MLSSWLPAVFQEDQAELLLEETFSWPILYISTLLQCVWIQHNSSLFTCLCAPWLGGLDYCVLRTEGVLVSSKQEMLKKNFNELRLVWHQGF